jgi:small-conductance mechanosensitive channel
MLSLARRKRGLVTTRAAATLLVALPLVALRLVATPLVATLMLLATLTSAVAQGRDGGGDAAAVADAGPKPVQASRIPAEAEETQDILRIISTRAHPDPQVKHIIENFPTAAKGLRERAIRDSQRLADANHHRGLLYTVTSDWQARREQLGVWRSLVEGRTSALARDMGQLSELRAKWKVTREAALVSSLSTALIELIDTTLLQIARTRKEVDGTLAPLLVIQDDIAELQRAVSSVLESARTAHDAVREHIFDINRPPIWDLEFKSEKPPWIAAGEIFVDEIDRSYDYVRSHSNRVMAYGLIGALVLFFLRWLSLSEVRRASEAGESDPGIRVLGRPWSATTFVMIFGTIFYFDDAPLLMFAFAVVALVVPMNRLLPATNLSSTRWAAYILGGWMLVEMLRQNFVPEPIVSRVILLAEAISVTVLFVFLLRPSRLAKVQGATRTLRAIGSGLRFVAPLAMLSLASNVVGNVAFAEVLIEGTLTALYASFITYVLDQLLNSIWAAVLETPEAGRLRMVSRHGALLRRRGDLWIRITMRLLWLHIALAGFRIRNVVYDGLWDALNARSSLGELEVALIDFLLLGLMIWLSFVISGFVRFVLDEEILPRTRVTRGAHFSIATMVRYVLLVLGFMLAVTASGMDTSRFALMAGALGVGIGIGLQDVFNNFVSGLILLFERPIQIGHTVEVNGLLGEVKQIGLRASTLRTFDGAEVVLPNSAFVSNYFVNWTLSDRSRRIEIPIGVAYASDPDRVIEVLTAVLAEHASIQSHPPPVVLFDGFGDSSLNFLMRGWTLEFERWRGIKGEIGIQTIHALKAAGIEIPFPQRDLHLRSVSPDLRGEGD